MQTTRTGVLGETNIPCRIWRSTGSGSECSELQFEPGSGFHRARLSHLRLTALANAGSQSRPVEGRKPERVAHS
jgi:hypothetical protein